MSIKEKLEVGSPLLLRCASSTGFLDSAILQQLVGATNASHIHNIAIRNYPRKLAVESHKLLTATAAPKDQRSSGQSIYGSDHRRPGG
jgi:hypothetical protein